MNKRRIEVTLYEQTPFDAKAIAKVGGTVQTWEYAEYPDQFPLTKPDIRVVFKTRAEIDAFIAGRNIKRAAKRRDQ